MNDDDHISNHPNPSRWWRWRRILMFMSFAWTIAQTFVWIAVGIHSIELLSALSIVIGWSYGIPTTAIIAYLGGSSFSDYLNRGK